MNNQIPHESVNKATKHVAILFFIMPLIGSLFCIALAIAVFIGWYTHNLALIQILPDLVPMQYNTALGFLLIGAGLLISLLKLPKIGGIIGFLAAVLGLLTLIEYIFALDLHIDQLFMNHYITVETQYPGRMAPNTALCFVLSGLSLFWVCIKSSIGKRIYIVTTLNCIVAVLGAISFFGYLMDFSTLIRWGAMTNMAWHTAFGFLVWGISAQLAITFFSIKHNLDLRLMQPMIAFFLSMFVFILLWQIVIFNESKGIRLTMKNVSDEISKEFQDRLKTEFTVLQRLSSRWVINRGTKHESWMVDVNNYLTDHKSIYSIGWINTKGDLTWNVRNNSNNIPGHSLWPDEKNLLSNEAKRNKTYIVSKQFSYNKNNYFVAYFPIRGKDYFDGYVAVLYNFENLSSSVISNVIFSEYNIQILSNNKIIYSPPAHRATSLKKYWSVVSNFKKYGKQWTIIVWPSWELLQDNRSWASFCILFCGLIFSLIVALLFKIKQDLSNEKNLLRSSNNDLESFSYSISHDLRSPLRHIVGFIDLLKKEENANLADNSKRYLNIISESASRMSALIDGILMLSRAGRKEMSKTFFPLDELISEVLTDLSPEYHERQIEWSINELPTIYADRSSFKLVMQNLLSNAIKFTRLKDPAKIMVSCSTSGNYNKICISDNGAGFKSEYTNKIFTLFHRLHKESEYEGTGIGLANVERIVRRHHGKVWAESELGQGATFFVLIPSNNNEVIL